MSSYASIINHPDPFIITVDTTKAGSATDTFILPLYPGTTNCVVEWGDDTSDHIKISTQTDLTHVYPNSGSYQVSIIGNFVGTYFANGGDKLKLSSIDQWGSNSFTNMTKNFQGCENMVANYTDVPNVSECIAFFGAFQICRSFNGSIAGWDFSNSLSFANCFEFCDVFDQPLVINAPLATTYASMLSSATSFNSSITIDSSNSNSFAGMFGNCTVFNQPVNLDTSKATNLSNMFINCVAFDQDINFTTPLVNNMSAMFSGCHIFNSSASFSDTSNVTLFTSFMNQCRLFNQPITLDTTGATNMLQMFGNCWAFNQDVSWLTTTGVTNMQQMFTLCYVFDQDVSHFDTSLVTTFLQMFRFCYDFNQDLSSWDIGSLISTGGSLMFDTATSFTHTNYSSSLIGWTGWDNQPSGSATQYVEPNVTFTGPPAGVISGSHADRARTYLVDIKLWTITDGGYYVP